MIQVREITGTSELDALREPWTRVLHASAVDTVFLTHEWMRTWWKHFGADDRLLLLVLSEGEELAGIVPCFITRTEKAFGLFRKLGFVGTGLSDYLGPILPDPTPELVDALLAALLDRSRAWDYIDFREIPDPRLAELLALRARNAGLAAYTLPDSACVHLPIRTDWATFTREGMHKRSRRRMRTREKLLQEAGEPRFRFCDDLSADPDALGRIAQMPQDDSYRGERRRGVFEGPRRRRFIEEISRVFSERGWLLLSELHLNDRPAAYGLGFLYRGRFLFYSMGFDPGLEQVSPGRVLVDHLLQECFRRHLEEVDFMRGAESWKSSFSSEVRPNARMMAFRRSPRGELARRFSPKPAAPGRERVPADA